ncbi:DUF3040 domain-containing protein [Pseudonocardia sp. RS11V-5]|uniref:DUF3040 domain-containing protein n=1 Tax=Pseudonocardia terrae TaxID=2905831 RepID=UPI001E344CD5|nr:DUF3040 domain-containing protein [Pseudonocardia terrae]MCE3553177.1 DUF3040 domain-containing protein [Pseudonocardia terrae]
MLSHRDKQTWAEIERHLLADPDIARLVRQTKAGPVPAPVRWLRDGRGIPVTLVVALLIMVLCAVVGLILPALLCAGLAALTLVVHAATHPTGRPGDRPGQ